MSRSPPGGRQRCRHPDTPPGVRHLLSIVILAHDKSDLTRSCLEALTRVDHEIEVLVVDNASTDDTPAVVRAFDGRLPLTVLRSETNRDFATANNAAADVARGETLLFLNNDVVVTPDAPGRLARAVEEAGGGVAGPKLLFPDGTVQHAGMAQMLWGYASNLGTGGVPAEPALNRGGDVFAVTGAMLAIDRALFTRLRGFDSGYRWGYEDVDLCLAARQAGAPVRYVPGVTSTHVESATLASARKAADASANYARYRRRWNHVLVPGERRALAALRDAGVRRVVVFGAGLAARGLTRALRRGGIAIEAFTSTHAQGGERFLGRPVVPLEDVRRLTHDRLIVASQHYYALRDRLDAFDPTGAACFPRIDS